MRIIGTVIINAVAIWVATWLLPGLTVATDRGTLNTVLTYLAIGAVFGVVNAFVRPVVAFLSLPLYILTLGLFAFVVNAAMLWLTSWLADLVGLGFQLDEFWWTAIWGAIIISIVSMIGNAVLGTSRNRQRQDA